MKASIKVLGMAAATTLLLGSTFTAQAAAQASGTVTVPYESGGRVYAKANLNGPVPATTRFCVYLNALSPNSPDITMASACRTGAGTVTASAPRPACGNYTTWAAATYNGSTTYQDSTGYKLFC